MSETTLKPGWTTTPPHYKLPPNSCDCHSHVFGPFDRFPLSPSAHFQPPNAPLEQYVLMHEIAGFDRGVLTQPSHYTTDNSALLDALAHTKGMVKGIVTLAPDSLTPAEVSRLDKVGVRGVRIQGGSKSRPTVDDMEAVADRIAGAGWHIELFPPHDMAAFVALRPRLEKLAVPVLFDKMGGPDIERGLDDPSFLGFLDMLKDGLIWVKLSHPYHMTPHPYAPLLPYVRAIVAANPKRSVFATDWPHPRMHQNPPVPDTGFLVDLLREWVPDEETRRMILVDNPAEIYRF